MLLTRNGWKIYSWKASHWDWNDWLTIDWLNSRSWHDSWPSNCNVSHVRAPPLLDNGKGNPKQITALKWTLKRRLNVIESTPLQSYECSSCFCALLAFPKASDGKSRLSSHLLNVRLTLSLDFMLTKASFALILAPGNPDGSSSCRCHRFVLKHPRTLGGL